MAASISVPGLWEILSATVFIVGDQARIPIEDEVDEDAERCCISMRVITYIPLLQLPDIAALLPWWPAFFYFYCLARQCFGSTFSDGVGGEKVSRNEPFPFLTFSSEVATVYEQKLSLTINYLIVWHSSEKKK